MHESEVDEQVFAPRLSGRGTKTSSLCGVSTSMRSEAQSWTASRER